MFFSKNRPGDTKGLKSLTSTTQLPSSILALEEMKV